MTTNHRPTLEAKQGKAQSIRDTIAHSRALPTQTSLKYRNDINIDDAKAAVQELKAESLARRDASTGNEGKKIRLTTARDRKETTPVVDSNEEVVNKAIPTSDLGSESPIIAGTDAKAAATHPAAQLDGRSEEESDEESEDETELLMQELQKLKQQKEAQNQKQKQELEKKASVNKPSTSNPLIQIDSDSIPTKKKSWRKSTAFRNQPLSYSKLKTKEDEAYTNNTLKSENHKRFMSKYIR